MRLALLKAGGLTPRQLVAIAPVENLALGLAGGLAGILIGVALAPSLIRRSEDLLGGVPTDFDPLTALVVIGVVEALIALVTIAVTLCVASFVAVLAMEATLNREDVAEAVEERTTVLPADPAGLAPTRLDPVAVPDLGREQIRPIVWGLNTLLMAAVVANLLATAILFVRERTRETGVLRAVGFTPLQVLSGLLGSQTAIAAPAAAAGIPLGLIMFGGLYRLAGGEGEFLTMPPAWQLLLVPFATIAAVALVALLPARRATGGEDHGRLAGRLKGLPATVPQQVTCRLRVLSAVAPAASVVRTESRSGSTGSSSMPTLPIAVAVVSTWVAVHGQPPTARLRSTR